MAQDNGVPTRTAYEVVYLTLTRNENTPIWLQPSSGINYRDSVSVLENTGFNTAIYNFQARDNDVVRHTQIINETHANLHLNFLNSIYKWLCYHLLWQAPGSSNISHPICQRLNMSPLDKHPDLQAMPFCDIPQFHPVNEYLALKEEITFLMNMKC